MAGRKKTGNIPVSCRVDAYTGEQLTAQKPYAKKLKHIVEAYFKHKDVKQLIDSKK